MLSFNRGKPYHGSAAVEAGKLRGATVDTDYFYFFCPKCSDENILRILDYAVHAHEAGNPYNSQVTVPAKEGFTLVFQLYCEKCEFTDFVKLSNTGWQEGNPTQMNRWLGP